MSDVSLIIISDERGGADGCEFSSAASTADEMLVAVAER